LTQNANAKLESRNFHRGKSRNLKFSQKNHGTQNQEKTAKTRKPTRLSEIERLAI